MHKEDMWESPLTFLVFAICMEVILLSLTIVDEMVYSHDGQGFWWMRLIQSMMRIGSKFFMMCIMVMMASGWTFTFTNFSEKEDYLFVMGVALAANTFLLVLNALDLGEYHKFHDFSGITGFLIILTRISMWVFFVNRANNTQKRVNDKHAVLFR